MRGKIRTAWLGTALAIGLLFPAGAHAHHEPVYWEGKPLKKGQVGALTIIKKINLYKKENGKLTFVRVLNPKENYRIYKFEKEFGGQFGLGGNHYIPNKKGYVTYRTPSKAKLDKLNHNQVKPKPPEKPVVKPEPPKQPEKPPVPPPPPPPPPVEAVYTSLGTQVTKTVAIQGATGVDKDGNALMYVLLQGNPAQMAVIDLKTNTLRDIESLANATTAWGLDVGPDGTVWVGGTPNFRLYSYHPDEGTIVDRGRASNINNNSSIMDIEATTKDGTVYIGAAYGGSVISYHKDTGFKQIGKAETDKKYLRTLAMDQETNDLIVGVGSKANLFKWNLTTNEKTALLPDDFKGASYVYDLNVENGLAFAKLNPDQRMAVMDLKTNELVNDLQVGSRGTSPKAPFEEALYYTYRGKIYRYDLVTRQAALYSSGLQGNEAVSLDFVQLNSPEWPGYTLIGLAGNSGKFYRHNFTTGKTEVGELPVPSQTISIYNLFSGPSGEVYSSGFVSGGVGIYNPETNISNFYGGIGQIEGMAVLGNSIYFGTYPSAKILRYNPGSPFLGISGSNPRELFTLSSAGMDRPVAVHSVERMNKLYIGSHPRNGHIGGLFTVYDPETGMRSDRIDMFPGQSVISLTDSGDYLYGGTTIYGGGAFSYDQYARFFRLPLSDPGAAPEVIDLPIKAKLLSALTTDSSGNIYGLADATLFKYNPATGEFITAIVSASSSGVFSNGRLVMGLDGKLYGTVEKTFFRADLQNLKVEHIRKNAEKLVRDQKGNFYFKSGYTLYKAEIKN
ncbi:hypothetical protein ACFQPF_15605 [Fictibacillus iocasae]|uniref:Uncharacterized protein n=1 Tax=Fictibacillus iocasae TaxID=2715437 RepID=A0ABW2NWR6_9BACL